MIRITSLVLVLQTAINLACAKETSISEPQTAFACKQNIQSKQSLYENKFVPIGGIDQWITIKGESCHNPVILFLHGGPGNPESIYAESIYKEWERHFTIVHWDQRGAGKTYGRNATLLETSDLNLDVMVSDGIAVAQYLRSYLNKQKLILMGGSWGAVLGMHMVHKNPNLFYAYLASAQAGLDKDYAKSYDKTLLVAQQNTNGKFIESLNGIGKPPWTNIRSFGVMRRVQRPLERTLTEPWPKEWAISSLYQSPEYREMYIAGEDYSYVKFMGFKGDGFVKNIDINRLGYNVDVPIFMMQGAEDLLTIPEVTKAYFDKLNAPIKQYYLLPKVGHAPNRISHEKSFKILTEQILPLTQN